MKNMPPFSFGCDILIGDRYSLSKLAAVASIVSEFNDNYDPYLVAS